MDVNLQAEGTLDYDGFTTLLKRLLTAAWGDKWGVFTSDAPLGNDPNNITFPVITYALKFMQPGKVGKTTREIRPRQRMIEYLDDVNGTAPNANTILGQVMDAEVVFEVWEDSNADVEKLAKRFRDFMTIYSGYFKSQGLRNIRFAMMNDISEGGRIRENAVCRKLIYQVQFEELTVVPSDVFNIIDTSKNQLALEKQRP
jgi:hypothetical protein